MNYKIETIVIRILLQRSTKPRDRITTHVLAVGPLLTVDLKVPREGCLEVGLLFRVLQVDLLVRVGFPIRSDVNDGLDILASGNEDTLDQRVVVGAEDAKGTEEVLSGAFQTVWLTVVRLRYRCVDMTIRCSTY